MGAFVYSEIEVVVSGAVQRAGRVRLDADATVASALQAAGGLAYRPHAVPAGDLVLRRRHPTTRRVAVYRWRLGEPDADDWRSFPLESRDVLVFAWSLRGEDG